jgi:hypothetical protein
MIRRPHPLNPNRPPPGGQNFVPEGWEPYTERDRVLEWRAEQLQRAGVPEQIAERLSRAEADLHTMLSVAQRVPPERLLDIFE